MNIGVSVKIQSWSGHRETVTQATVHYWPAMDSAMNGGVDTGAAVVLNVLVTSSYGT